MLLLYVRLHWRERQPSSPQKNCSDQDYSRKSVERNHLSQKAHQSMVNKLRQVESNYALNRRLFL